MTSMPRHTIFTLASYTTATIGITLILAGHGSWLSIIGTPIAVLGALGTALDVYVRA